jgi:hypothetical protein
MFVIISLLGLYVADRFKSRHRLEVENLFLRPGATPGHILAASALQ